jgi:hypothetical protein
MTSDRLPEDITTSKDGRPQGTDIDHEKFDNSCVLVVPVIKTALPFGVRLASFGAISTLPKSTTCACFECGSVAESLVYARQRIERRCSTNCNPAAHEDAMSGRPR